MIHGQLIAGQLIAWTHNRSDNESRVTLSQTYNRLYCNRAVRIVSRKPTANRAATFEIRINSIKLDR